MRLDPAQLRALAEGETVVAIVDATDVRPSDAVLLEAGSPGRRALKPGYRRWLDRAPEGEWPATVTAAHRTEDLDPERFHARHVLADHPQHAAAVVLRVRDGDGRPVLSDVAFSARCRSVTQALR